MLLDTYFARIHGKPYNILDEAATRQRMQNNQLPTYLTYAIYAVSARWAVPLTLNCLRLTLSGMHPILVATMALYESAECTPGVLDWSLILTNPQLRHCKLFCY